MELEKPKTKRKTRNKSTDVRADTSAPSLSDVDVDIEFPSTAAAALDSLPSAECSASSQALLLEDAIDDDGSCSTTTSTPAQTAMPMASETYEIVSSEAIPGAALTESVTLDTSPLHQKPVVVATAPQIVVPALHIVERVQYPDLQHMQRELHVLPNIDELQLRSSIAVDTMRPFTSDQMRDLYDADVELAAADAFEQQFVHTELKADYRRHALHELLTKYARCRRTLRHNRMDVAAAHAEFERLEPELWRREKRTVNYQASCADSVVVRASEEYEFASIDETVFTKVSTHLNEMLNLVSFHCALNLYLAETHKLQITHIVQQMQQMPVGQSDAVQQMRVAISIFFHFLRRSLPDQAFGDDLKRWLGQLVANLLVQRDASPADCWPDRLFLTLHVMRCPAGVSDWAAAFVQLPRPTLMQPSDTSSVRTSPFAAAELHQCVAYLRTLLRPIEGRTDFLRQNERRRRARATSDSQPLDPVKEDLWILVDSDGDDDIAGAADAASGPGEVLKENDLIALLNQMPLEQLFGSITLATNAKGQYVIDPDTIQATHLLQLIAFANALVQLLGGGLITYNTERYRQFAKRLGRLIRHTVVYVSESYALYKRGAAFTGLSPATRARIGVEFDVFVLRAADYIYRSRCLGAWQYLALLPFADLRAETVWKLYYFLVAGGPAGVIDGGDATVEDSVKVWKMKAQSEGFLLHFNDTIVDVPAEDMYYLLQTFASIAQSRNADDLTDRELIERVLIDLFEIGFVNAATTETSYKIVRDLLANITDDTPALLSILLERTKLRFRDIDNSNTSTSSAVYLFKALPLDRWLPTERDFEITATWLLHCGCDSDESVLARAILSRLNWGFGSATDGSHDEHLHLSADVHVRMACLLCEVAAKQVPETVGLSGITESVRQVSNLVKGAATAQQIFAAWCWNMVTVLRLHGMDMGREARTRLLHEPAQCMQRVPELERLAAVHEGCSGGRPLAIYVAVLATHWGHSVPLVCHRGFAQMALLLQDYRQSAVVRCLELVTPLFVECSESLSKCDAFQSILAQLLNADKTYMKMAKDLIANDYPGPVVEMLGQMIQTQCIGHHNYAFATPLPLIMLWLESITAPAAWQRDSNAVYLVDLVLRIAWQTPAMWSLTKEFFRFLCTNKRTADESKLSVRTPSSFLPPFLGGSSSSAGAALAMLPPLNANTAWMSLLTLELEHEILELQTLVWPELLRQLRAVQATSRFSLDSVIKTAASAVHCSQPPTAATLVLYRLVHLMLACTPENRLLPVVVQRFFHLYLARVPMAGDETRFASAFGVADKFYEHNVSLMKRLKKHFAHVEAELKALALRCEDEPMAAFHAQCSRLFGTYGLWLEETRLNQLSGGAQQYAEFPPQYETARLARIFGGADEYWMDFVSLPAIRQQQRVEASKWQHSCFRTQSTANRRVDRRVAPSGSGRCVAPLENIVRQLATYDAPLMPPRQSDEKLIIPSVTDTRRLLGLLQSDFAHLNATTRLFHENVQELNFTDCNYKDLVRVLYSNRSQRCTRTLRCSSLLSSSSSCRGGRDVQITITEPIVDGRIQNKIERNREKHQLNVDRQLSAPPADAVLVFVRIQHYVRYILAHYGQLQQLSGGQLSASSATNKTDLYAISAVGIAFFYEIVNGMSEFADAFPPAHELLGDVLAQLGCLIRDNQSSEGVRLLQTTLRRPHLVQLLSEMFTPSATAPVYFLEMYRFVVDSHMQKCDTKILFVLLSKFDVAKWLVIHMPKLIDISQLLKTIVQGLESWNQPDAALIQGLLRRHLVHIFQYDFPEHYGEVLQTVLIGCSDQRLLPTVLAELLQAIYQLASCPEPPTFDVLQAALTAENNPTAVGSDARGSGGGEYMTTFAVQQQLFGFKAVQDTLAMLAQHFRTERLQHGLHGLYPKHREYCAVLSVLLRSYGYALVVTAVYAYPGLLADKLLDWLWPTLCDAFAPWLVPYYPQTMQQQQQPSTVPSHAQLSPAAVQPANWIRQVLANADVLLPWSELYAREAQHMAHAYVDCTLYLLDTLPGSDQLLGHLFHWYEAHFAHVCVPRHVRQPLHAALRRLPWERFRPQPVHIECIHRALQQFLPESHAFMGHVFVRVQWAEWLRQQLPLWDRGLRGRMLAALLQVYTKLSFEPNVRESHGRQLLAMLQEAAAFPWTALPGDGLVQVMDSLVLIAEPAIVLTTLNAERHHEAVDAAVLNILQLASCMRTNMHGDRQSQAKRILYVKTIVRLLRLCGSKNQQLLTTADGVTAFRAAVMRLLNAIDELAGGGQLEQSERAEAVERGMPITDREIVDLMIEVVGSLQLPGEFTSKIFVEAVVQWQADRDSASPLVHAMLNAIGTCKVFTNNVIALLEATLYHYFRLYDPTATDVQNPCNASWTRVAARLGPSLPVIEGTELVQRHHLLTLHVFTVYKLRALSNVGEQLTLLQKLHLILENYKTCDATEPKLLALWSLMIVFGVQRLHHSDNAKSLLLTLGRFLQSASAHPDGWGDGVLGALGLRRDGISRRRRLATRCLACVVFSLFPDTIDPRMPCKEYTLAIDELAAHIQSKRYADVRTDGLLAIELVQTQRNATAAIASGIAFEAQTTQNICALLRLFYKEAGFLATLESVWLFNDSVEQK